MDIKECDRCGQQFRVFTAPGFFIPHGRPSPATKGDLEPPKPPKGLQFVNKVVLPLTLRDDDAKDGVKEWVSVQQLDICPKCVAELAPLVKKWLIER